jgi:cytochrome c551
MKKTIALLAGCVLLLTACGQGGGQQETATNDGVQKIGDPQKVFSEHCANCHGADLQGSFGPPLNHIGSKYSEQQILAIIQKGKGNMPPQTYVHPDDQKALAAWLAKKK